MRDCAFGAAGNPARYIKNLRIKSANIPHLLGFEHYSFFVYKTEKYYAVG